MANTYLTRTFGSTPTMTKFTWSGWVKKSKLGTQQAMISGYQNSNTGQLFYFTGDDKLAYYAQAGGVVKCNVITNAVFKDTSAWYHIMLVVDSTQSNAANRVKFYVNNVLKSYATTVAHALNWEAYFMMTVPTNVGRNGMNTSNYFEGVMSHMHMTHGYLYTPSTFGETDSLTGEWKIKTDPTVNYNSNGFFILKNTNTGTDYSGNSETFSSGGGTLTKTEDNPSNVFATLNPLDNYFAQNTFSYGNTRQLTDNSRYAWSTSTLGMTSGKYYCEVRHSGNIGDNYPEIGIAGRGLEDTSTALGTVHNTVSYQYNGQILINGTASSFGSAYSSTAIIGIALDVTNSKIYFSLNGVWQGGGNPTTGANGKTITTVSTVRLGAYFFAGGDYGNSSRVTFDWNFGNGYFNSTAVSSAGTNASGNGIFEHDVPTGFTALSTKGLNL